MVKKRDEEEDEDDELDEEEDEEDLDDDELDEDDMEMSHRSSDTPPGSGKLFAAIALVGISLLVIGIVLGMFLAPEPEPAEKVDLTDIENKIDNLTVSVSSLEGDISDLDDQMVVKDDKIERQNDQITGLNGDITGLQANITDNQTKISELQAAVLENLTRLQDAYEAQDLLEQNISELNLLINELRDNITTQMANIDSLEDVISELEQQLEEEKHNSTKAALTANVMPIHLNSKYLNFDCSDCHATAPDGELTVDPVLEFTYEDLNGTYTFRKGEYVTICTDCHTEFPAIMDSTYKDQDCTTSGCHNDWKTRMSAASNVNINKILDAPEDCLLCHGDQAWYKEEG